MDSFEKTLEFDKIFLKTRLERMRRQHLFIAYAALVLGIAISIGIFFSNEPTEIKFLISIIAMFLAVLAFFLSRKLLKDNLKHLDKKICQITSSLLSAPK